MTKATFDFKYPKDPTTVDAIVASADGTGHVTRPRQVENQIVERRVPVSGVIATAVCEKVSTPILEGEGEDAKEVGAEVSFDGVDAGAFKLVGKKATGVPKKGSLSLELPEDFSGVVMINARRGSETELLEAIDVEPKDD